MRCSFFVVQHLVLHYSSTADILFLTKTCTELTLFSFDRLHGIRAPIPVSDWAGLSRHDQRGADPVWEGDAVRAQFVRRHEEEEQHPAPHPHRLPLQRRPVALLRRARARSV